MKEHDAINTPKGWFALAVLPMPEHASIFRFLPVFPQVALSLPSNSLKGCRFESATS
jgi:hypothetical protein